MHAFKENPTCIYGTCIISQTSLLLCIFKGFPTSYLISYKKNIQFLNGTLYLTLNLETTGVWILKTQLLLTLLIVKVLRKLTLHFCTWKCDAKSFVWDWHVYDWNIVACDVKNHYHLISYINTYILGIGKSKHHLFHMYVYATEIAKMTFQLW